MLFLAQQAAIARNGTGTKREVRRRSYHGEQVSLISDRLCAGICRASLWNWSQPRSQDCKRDLALLDEFIELRTGQPDRGAHDYNDGYVLPAAINLACRSGHRRGNDRIFAYPIREHARDVHVHLDRLPAVRTGHWSDLCSRDCICAGTSRVQTPRSQPLYPERSPAWFGSELLGSIGNVRRLRLFWMQRISD